METGGAFRISWPNSNTFISIWNYTFVSFWTVTLLVGVQNDRHGGFDVIFDLNMKLSTMCVCVCWFCVCVHEQSYVINLKLLISSQDILISSLLFHSHLTLDKYFNLIHSVSVWKAVSAGSASVTGLLIVWSKPGHSWKPRCPVPCEEMGSCHHVYTITCHCLFRPASDSEKSIELSHC